MKGALLILAFLIIIGVILWLLDRRAPEKTSQPRGSAIPEQESSECCGQHMICEKTALTPLSDKIEYFDDEEIDRFAGRAPDSYTAAETEELRDILLTLRPEEVPAWARSLQLRNIQLPSEIRDELLLIASDLRFPSSR